MMKQIVLSLFMIVILFAQDIFRTRLSDVFVEDAENYLYTQFTTRVENDYVYLSVDPIGVLPPIDILRTRLKDIAVQDFDFAGDTLVGFTTSGPDLEGWVYLTAVLKNGGTGDILRTKLKDCAVDSYTAPNGYWISSFTTSGPDAEGWIYLTAVASLIGVEEKEFNELEITKNVFYMNDVVPNPATSSIQIDYSIANPCLVNLTIYDASGRLVRTLIDNEYQRPDFYKLRWEGVDQHGHKTSSGIYFVKLKAGEFCAMKKLVLLK